MKPLQPPATNPSSVLYYCIYVARSSCHRRHHDVRQRHHPALVHHHTPTSETPLLHAAETRRRRRERRHTTPPHASSIRRRSTNDAPNREHDTVAPPSPAMTGVGSVFTGDYVSPTRRRCANSGIQDPSLPAWPTTFDGEGSHHHHARAKRPGGARVTKITHGDLLLPLLR